MLSAIPGVWGWAHVQCFHIAVIINNIPSQRLSTPSETLAIFRCAFIVLQITQNSEMLQKYITMRTVHTFRVTLARVLQSQGKGMLSSKGAIGGYSSSSPWGREDCPWAWWLTVCLPSFWRVGTGQAVSNKERRQPQYLSQGQHQPLLWQSWP